tara:strand:- start:225 stop:422 length:198 start_codon:yes stop_codon:yes gene_type:complete
MRDTVEAYWIISIYLGEPSCLGCRAIWIGRGSVDFKAFPVALLDLPLYQAASEGESLVEEDVRGP